ncbi:MAG: hypothetical protein IPM76_20605 [Chloroflexi bacterium]|nr:hypothetical protein [Chloroflexota bacterium]
MTEAFSYPGFVRLFYGRYSAKAKALPLGSPQRRPPKTSTPPTAPSWNCSPKTNRCTADQYGPEAGSFQGLLRRVSAGWVTVNGPKLGLKFNEMVASGEGKAPIVIGRDHLDAGSVAEIPNRETESMKDGSTLSALANFERHG